MRTMPAPPPERAPCVPITSLQQLSSAQRRVLTSLGRQAGAVRKRELQQRLHRLPARELNRALDALVAAALVRRNGDRLTLPGPVRAALLLAEIRAGGRWPTPWPARHPGHVQAQQRRPRRSLPRAYRRRPIPNRHRDPRRWALSMRGRLGGLRAQQAYRARGVIATARATQARALAARAGVK